VSEYAEVNVAVALALPSDDLLAVVIRRADERPLSRDRDPAAFTSSSARRPVPCPKTTSTALLHPEQLRHAAHRDLATRAHPGQAAVLGVAERAADVVDEADPRAGVCGEYSQSRSPTTTHRERVPAGRFLDDLAELLQTGSATLSVSHPQTHPCHPQCHSKARKSAATSDTARGPRTIR